MLRAGGTILAAAHHGCRAISEVPPISGRASKHLRAVELDATAIPVTLRYHAFETVDTHSARHVQTELETHRPTATDRKSVSRARNPLGEGGVLDLAGATETVAAVGNLLSA